LDWIFLVDTLNFSFWTAEGETPFACDGHRGYWSLCAAVNRALREGTSLTTSVVMAGMSRDALKHVFRGDDGSEPPMLDERLRVVTEAGRVLLEK
jgi:hypothetical protein